MSDFQAIFFDFDGVLLDTEPVHWACWAEMLATMKIRLSWEYYRDFCIGIDDRDMLRAIGRQADPPRDWESLWELYPAKKKLFQERMTSPPFERELVEMLPRLRREYRMAVVSSCYASEIEPLLVAGGIREHFDTIVGGEMVQKHKPAPEPYLLAAERLAVQRALVLEDSAAGIASGKAAGFEVIAIKHPTDVPGLLRGKLNGRPARTGGVK
jgi:beta-phosphoglucomutase